MLICSMIAPGWPSVDMAGNLFNAWGGRELTWLHPLEAAEFEIAYARKPLASLARSSGRWALMWSYNQRRAGAKSCFYRYGQHDDPAGMY